MEQFPQDDTSRGQTWETLSVRGTGFAPSKKEELVPPPVDGGEDSEFEGLVE